MSATQLRHVKGQTCVRDRPDATRCAKTASTPDVGGPHYDPVAGWLHGGAPKSATRHPPSPPPPADTEGCPASDPERPVSLSGPPPAQAVGAESSLAAWVVTGLRASQAMRGTWALYCDMHGGGVTDPTRHSTDHIVGFADYLGQLVAADLQATCGPLATPGPQPGASVNAGLFHPGARESSTLGLYRRAMPQSIAAVEGAPHHSP